MLQNNQILLAKGEKEIHLLLSKANRHGVITGATGTGKTVTLKVLAESFSDAGVPVFLADIKGDLSGMCKKGEMNDNIQGGLKKRGIPDFELKISQHISLMYLVKKGIQFVQQFLKWGHY